MDTTLAGNLCKDPTLHQALRTGRPVARFTIASNPRRWDGSTWVERPPVFHDVVCFGELAENVTNTLRTGMNVVVVGEWADNSYTDELGHRRIRIVLEAKLVGPNLRWATAVVSRTERRPKPNQPALALVAAPAAAIEPAEPVPVGSG